MGLNNEDGDCETGKTSFPHCVDKTLGTRLGLYFVKEALQKQQSGWKQKQIEKMHGREKKKKGSAPVPKYTV